MSDLVTCPGCGAGVDRDERLLCPDCHTDLTTAPSAALDPAPAAEPAPAPGPDPTPQPDPAGWRCASPGCEHATSLAWTVEVCPYCLQPRTAAPDPFELRDEARAIVVRLAGLGPWRLGRGEADSAQLSGCMTVSRSHAVVARRLDDLTVRDLGSSNGTFVGDMALSAGEERVVAPGATIGLGRTVVLRVSVDDGTGPR